MSQRYLKFLVPFLFFSCGEHIEDPIFLVTIGPPQNVMAYSVNSNSIRIEWSAAIGVGDTTFLGYIIEHEGVEDSIPKTQEWYVADSLSPGTQVFTVYSYQSDGPRTDGVMIAWAAAERFDIPTFVTEYFLQSPFRLSGFDAGSQTTDPEALALEPIGPIVIERLDLYLFGGSGQVSDPLAMRSAQLFQVDLRESFFSTVSDSSETLDFARSTFPDASTFTENEVTVRENRIYYLLFTGDDELDPLYARLHVRIVPGLVFPDRQVEIRVSLQRTPGVPFA